MTAPGSTEPTRCDIPAVHASISPVDALLDARRTLYRFAFELLDPMNGRGLQPELVDSPSIRGRIGQALATGDGTLCAELVPIDAVVAHRGWLCEGPVTVPVASHVDANRLLSDALGGFLAELVQQCAATPSLRLMTAADGDAFSAAVDLVRDGIALARTINAALVDDLLAHVALVGIVDPAGAEPLVSASSRRFPGLVLLGKPASAMEVAEGLVHEAAHQKLF